MFDKHSILFDSKKMNEEMLEAYKRLLEINKWFKQWNNAYSSLSADARHDEEIVEFGRDAMINLIEKLGEKMKDLQLELINSK